ncbi:MAG: beta-galactosidase, partial [Muribaculaceae bacterium]|nr:beta-galactosidase [Muribaculaceae bacterium]
MTIPLLGLGLMFGAHSMHASSPRVPDYLILGGELGNSSASSKEDIQSIFPRLKDMGLNTVLMPVYWELTEPSEGKFDFSLLDEALSTARNNDLRLVLLWFGAWKNSMSCYAPGWVKTDVRRFPRAVTEDGKPLEILSAFSDNVLQADLNAFNAMLDHLIKYDQEGTVSMIQIENEIGMLESPRDHSKLADKEYAKGVPK